MKNKKQKKSGFTLVELMVVAIIVAILAAVAIPLMTGNTKRAMATEADAGIGTIASAMRMYKAENGSYPSAISAITNTVSAADLDGQFFDGANYSIADEVITCAGNATSGKGDGEGKANGLTTSFDVGEGTWSRNY